MRYNQLIKAGVLALVIVLIAIISWELYLRQIVSSTYYDDGGPLWADKRAMVYEPSDRSTVFAGSSRIKFDLDIPTWKNITGDHAIQLANVGTSPLPILEELSNDEKFKGRLVVDVTEPLYFSLAPPNQETALDNIAYYKKLSPTQRFSFEVNHALESQMVFLDQKGYSLDALLDRLPIQSRPGVFVFPTFPRDFGYVTFDRQSIMSDKFLADTNLQNQVKGIWQFFGNIARSMPPIPPVMIDSIFIRSKIAADKIVGRGGEVLFVRTPSSGPMYKGELMGFPREKYWDRLLKTTGCRGIYFTDYPAIAHFICPEWSHLNAKDAVTYTKQLATSLQNEVGWKFPKRL